jgi:hypothetical protein
MDVKFSYRGESITGKAIGELRRASGDTYIVVPQNGKPPAEKNDVFGDKVPGIDGFVALIPAKEAKL